MTSPTLNRASLESRMARFDGAQRDALFQSILAHDDIFESPAMPAAVPLARSTDELADTFTLVAKLFFELDTAARARAFLDEMIVDPVAAASTLDGLKHPRARFKHMQFTVHMCDARHRYPRLLHAVTVLMGEIQDACRHANFARAVRLGRFTRRMLGPAGQGWMTRELLSFRPSSQADYHLHIRRQIEGLDGFMGKASVTAQEFHTARKVISRLMAHYDSLKLLEPTADRVATARFISTLNGLMGGHHDDLVAQKLAGTINYRSDGFLLPELHRVMLKNLVQGFHAATHA